MYQSNLRTLDYENNTSQRTLCVLVLDLSDTMAMPAGINSNKRRIDMLNEGIQQFHQDLMQDETARNRVRLAIVIVGGPNNKAEISMSWTDAINFTPVSYRANGLTPLGEGVCLALDLIQDERKNLTDAGIGRTRPWMIILTDGLPTDSQDIWQAAIQRCKDAEKNNHCVIFPVLVDGNDAQVQTLQELSIEKPKHLSSVKFVEFFQWLSTSIKVYSRSRPNANASVTIQLGSIAPPSSWETTN